MSGKKRTATNVLEASNAFDKNPARKRARENEPTNLQPLGRPPTKKNHFENEERAAWRELVKHSHPGTLCHADRFIMEMAARLLVKIRNGDMRPALLLRFQTLLTELGMTPASRSKVSVAAVKDENEDFGSL